MTSAPADIEPAMVGFARALRAAGMPVGPDRVRAWADALRHLDSDSVAEVYWAGRLTLCGSPDDLRVYETTFRVYFGDMGVGYRQRNRPQVSISTRARMSAGSPSDGGVGRPSAVAASRDDVLRHRDLAQVTSGERDEINRLLAALSPGGPSRRSRRVRPAGHGTVDPARTVRAMLRHGGEPAVLRYRERRPTPRRLVLIIDVSGSMAAYADALLRFAHAACRRRSSTEVFTVGTRLTRVTRHLRHPDAAHALTQASAAVPDWSGGTRLGEQLQAFLDRWGQRGTARGAVVAVCSDGWEVGDTTPLAAQAERLRRLAHRVVWVSPHAGREGFVPEVAGLRAVEPSIDRLVAGDSVDALQRLAGLLSADRIDRAHGGT